MIEHLDKYGLSIIYDLGKENVVEDLLSWKARIMDCLSYFLNVERTLSLDIQYIDNMMITLYI